jgi:HEAT repeat protein
VREKVVAILGNIGGEKVVEHITQATSDEYPEVRRKARKALEKILYGIGL